jgi:hypothetical protein
LPDAGHEDGEALQKIFYSHRLHKMGGGAMIAAPLLCAAASLSRKNEDWLPEASIPQPAAHQHAVAIGQAGVEQYSIKGKLKLTE